MPSPKSLMPSSKRVEEAVQTVATATGIRPELIRSANRTRPVTRARWLVWKALVEEGFGYSPIAKRWPCDHTSIIYAEQRGWEP